MTLAFDCHPEAQAEFAAGVDWYDAREPGVGGRFAEAIRAAIDAIVADPAAWARWPRRGREPVVRSKGVSGSPFRVVYFVEHDVVTIWPWLTPSADPATGEIEPVSGAAAMRRHRSAQSPQEPQQDRPRSGWLGRAEPLDAGGPGGMSAPRGAVAHDIGAPFSLRRCRASPRRASGPAPQRRPSTANRLQSCRVGRRSRGAPARRR